MGGVARGLDSGPGYFWALGRESSLQSAVRGVGKVGSGSQFYCPRLSSRHPASWPSSHPTLRKTIVFLNTTTSSARTFSSELKQGTRERSGVGGNRGQNETAAGCDSTEDGCSVPCSWAVIDLKFLGVPEGWDEGLSEEAGSF